MATAALQIVGTSLGGPIGGIVGAAVGSYLDQAFIMPALFPQDPIQGPRIGELQLQQQDEGAPMNSTYGLRSRVAGVIIWSSELKELKTTEEVGGKGGGQEVENFSYSVDLAIAFADATTAYAAVDRIYADVGLAYDDTPNVNISSALLSCTVLDYYDMERPTSFEEAISVLTRKVLVIESPIAGPDLEDLKSGRDVVIAGWTETDYNGTFRCRSSKKKDDNSSVATFEISILASSAGESAGNTITIDQTNPKFDDADLSAATIHLGGPVQTVDSFLEGVLGVGNVSAFRDQVYVVIQNFQLEKYGNRIPHFQAVLVRGATDELDDVFNDVLLDSDMDSAEFDVTALAGITCTGYATRGPQPVLGRLQPLMMTFDVLGRETNGVLTFFLRGSPDTKVIDVDDLAATPEGSRDVSTPHLLDDSDVIQPPTEVLVKYVDDENQLQPGEQIERNPAAITKFQKQTVEVTITMTGGEGRDLAAKIMWMGYTGARVAEISLPPSYVDIQENDLLTYTYLGEPHQYLVDEINQGQDGTFILQLKRELAANLIHDSPHEAPQNPGTNLTSPYDCDLTIIDVAPLLGTHVNTPVLYFAPSSNQFAVGWRGASLLRSLDGGVNYTNIHAINDQATVGRTDTLLGAGTGPGQWDRGSVLEVTLSVGTLSSVTEIECLNGINRAIVADEIIGFVTATLAVTQPSIGTKYELTGLLRGLAGTEVSMSDHNLGDRFVHLNAVGVITVSMNISAIGVVRDYVAVSPGGDPLDFVDRTWIYGANNLKDFAPVQITSVRDVPATNDWTVGWQRRPRAVFRVLSQVTPHVEPVEDYEVDVYDVTGVTVLRIITSTATAAGSVVTIVNDNPQVVYDVTDQTTDHGSAQATIRLKVYQLNAALGRSKGTELLVIS